MLPTVADVLASPVIQAGKPEVIGGGPLDHPVRWVHVSDLADLSQLLQGGELVLTTGRPLADPHTRSDYLPGLRAAGAVGVVVELGPQLPQVSPELAAQADELGLPVAVLRAEVRFVEVTEHVHRAIVADQYDELVFARNAHEVFTGLSMRRASLDEIVEAVAEMVDAPVVLEDLNRQVLAFVARSRSTQVLLDDWERRSRLTPVTVHTAVSGPESWLTTPVGPHRQEWGRLVVPAPRAVPSRARMALERAAQALALHRMVEQDRTAAEQRAQSGLVDELCRGRIRDEAEGLARAAALGLRIGGHYIPVTVRMEGPPGGDQVLAQHLQVRLLDAMRQAVRSTGLTVLTAARRPWQFDLIVSLPSTDASGRRLSALCAAIRAALLRSESVSCCAIGVGAVANGLLEAAALLEDSAHIADVALSLPDDGKDFHRATDIRLRGLLASLRDDARVQAFAETELRGILDHDARHGEDTYGVLRHFLEVGGNKSELAKRLHASRPTLYARLATVQRLLGVDLDDPESRTSLHTAVLILDAPRTRRN
ncbi:PucR family transcriptional regulator [Nocardia sp. NPDC049707]|uniref:PucR family transcriptional regulator n=1 Tax=Nocardia sp. NPDC049707 TaxID=3154735 RepID=UPI003412EA48